MKLRTIVTERKIYTEGENPVYGQNSINIQITDEAAGPFLIISQSPDSGHVELRLEIEELELLAETGRTMYDHFKSQVKE